MGTLLRVEALIGPRRLDAVGPSESWKELPLLLWGKQSVCLKLCSSGGSIVIAFVFMSSYWVVSDSFATPWIVAHQAPLSMGFSKQEYWTGLPFPTPGDLPNPGIKPVSPALQANFLSTEQSGKLLDLEWERHNLRGQFTDRHFE